MKIAGWLVIVLFGGWGILNVITGDAPPQYLGLYAFFILVGAVLVYMGSK